MKIIGKSLGLCVFLVVCVLALSACSQETMVLIDTDSLIVTRTGAQISVCDRLGGDVYNFTISRRKRSEGPEKAAMRVKTDTIVIMSIPDCGLEIKSGGTVYRITQKMGVGLWLNR